MPAFSSASIMRSKQGHNPYDAIDEARTVIRDQGERIEFLLRALNDVARDDTASDDHDNDNDNDNDDSLGKDEDEGDYVDE
jgi:hypothetical protein